VESLQTVQQQMKNLKDYLTESEFRAENPDSGDTFAINLREECLVESHVVESMPGAFCLAADDKMLSILESYGVTFEDTGKQSLNEAMSVDDTLVSDRDINKTKLAESHFAIGDRVQCRKSGMKGRIVKLDKDHGADNDQYYTVKRDDGQLKKMAPKDLTKLDEQVMSFDNNQQDPDPGEYDDEGDMAKNELYTMIRSARKLIGMLDDADNMPEWTQKKITKATDYVDTAADYIASQKERGIMSESLDNAYEVHGNRHGYYVWRKSPVSQVLNIGITDPQLTGLTGWPVNQGILNYVERSMQPVSFNSLSSGIKKLILNQLPLQSTNKQNVNNVPPDDNRYKLSGDEYWAPRWAAIDKDQKLKQRLKTKPMSGPKGQLPEQGMTEGSGETSPVARAVLHRIMMQHTGLLAAHGPERVMDAVDELADRVNIGPDDEIGSSDVSAYVREVERALSKQGVAEGSRKAWMKHNNLVDLDPALKGLEDEMEKFIRLDPEERRKYQQGIKQRIKSDPMAGPKGVLPEQDMTEDLQADDGERYRSADDFFGQFEADHFDEERVSPDGMEVRGYIDGVNVMVWRFNSPRKTSGYGIYNDSGLNEAEYQGRKVSLGKPMQGDVKKFKVYVKDPSTGNIKKVNFGDPNMKIRKSNPGARKSFRARHNCDNPGPRTKARYWSCRKW
jgi:hypothetical protein